MRVAGHGHNPTCGNRPDMMVDWDWSWHRLSKDPITKVITPDIDKMALEVLTTGDVIKATFGFFGGIAPRTITNSQLTAALGIETDFKLRAYLVRSGFCSLNYDEVTMRKI